MSRTLLNRLVRLEATRATPKQSLVIVGADHAECDAQVKQAEAAGRTARRRPVLILTGVPRNRESIA